MPYGNGYFYTPNLAVLPPGTGTVLSADNGLTLNIPSNVRLGGSLLLNTTINTGSFSLTFTGNIATDLHIVTNAGAGGAIRANAVNGIGVFGNASGSGNGLQGNAVSGVGVQGFSSNGLAAQFSIQPAANNSVLPIANVNRFTSGTPANGIGGAIDYYIQANGAGGGQTSRLISKFTDAASATRSAAFEIWNRNLGLLERKMLIDANGKITFEDYGSGTFTGTAVKLLGVDVNGVVTEETIPAPGVQSVNGLTVNNLDPFNPMIAPVHSFFNGVPGVAEDISAGYIEFQSRVVDYNTQIEYLCVDDTVGAAVWKAFSGTYDPTASFSESGGTGTLLGEVNFWRVGNIGYIDGTISIAITLSTYQLSFDLPTALLPDNNFAAGSDIKGTVSQNDTSIATVLQRLIANSGAKTARLNITSVGVGVSTTVTFSGSWKINN